MRKITLEYSLKLNPNLNPELFMPDPKTVLDKIDKKPIRDWLEFISREYTVSKVENLILIPCSFYKPYDPPHDEFYRRIYELRKKAVNSKFITVSVPLALEPEEFWSFRWRGFNLIYDCPFFPWIEKFGYKWDERVVEEVVSRLKSVIDSFFERNKDKVGRVIAFFTQDSIELSLVRKHVDYPVLSQTPYVDVSYDNNTSEVYCHPENWSRFVSLLRRLRVVR